MYYFCNFKSNIKENKAQEICLVSADFSPVFNPHSLDMSCVAGSLFLQMKV